MSWQTPPTPQVAAWRWRKRKQHNRMHELKWQIRQSVTTDNTAAAHEFEIDMAFEDYMELGKAWRCGIL